MTIATEILPTCNQIVSGIVRYYTDIYEGKLIENEKSKLLASLANLISDKPVILKYSCEKLPQLDKTGANLLLLTIKTYWLNLMDCNIGEVAVYPEDETVSSLCIDDDKFHFQKVNNTDYPLWLRVK